MKKRLLLILMFITMFFIGSNDVFALECEVGGEDCTNITEAKDSINKQINKAYGLARLACLYEVELDNGKKYYSYIFYVDADDKFYAGTTLDGDLDKLNGGNALLLGTAYDDFYERNQCPMHNYLNDYSDNMFTRANKMCFDSDGTSCKAENNDFNITESSIRRENNADTIKYRNLTFTNACSGEYLPTGYKVCKYRGTNSIEYALLLYNGSSSQLIYNNMEGTKIILESGETITKQNLGTHENVGFVGSVINYENKLPKTMNTCPNYLYYNYFGLIDTDGGVSSYDYSWGLSKEDDAETVKRFEYKDCSDTTTAVEESVYESCGELLIGTGLQEDINGVMTIIRIAVPILLIALITYDFFSIAFIDADDKGNKIKSRSIKRIVIAIIIFFVPTLINLVFSLVNEVWGTNFETCGIDQNTE